MWIRMTNVFEEIYLTNVWGHSESHSGHGSSARATGLIRTALPQILSELGVKSMLDVPCGDFNWMRMLDLPIEYFGADIVPQLIEKNQRDCARPGPHSDSSMSSKIHSQKLILFSAGISSCNSPKKTSDPLSRTVSTRGPSILVTTTFTSRDKNVDIPTGPWRTLNLQRPPFSFPTPFD